ncbi:hypothetical protein L1987_11959 [Smallanthus sonchifolius]|uniref:Uncharacterized protein n=1 Tax=Smallanthus sonchifolius TaxID=185202 RepID=A0ACB9JEK1_9ASTR|nr:hypothetical protein L1987_11959 [Smallanthus sonchifolius]
MNNIFFQLFCVNLLEKYKEVLIENRVTLWSEVKNLMWAWRREPNTELEISDLFGLLSMIHDYTWAPGVDTWKWVSTRRKVDMVVK